MKHSISVFAVLAAMALANHGAAEIYETEDAQGNKVFTDVPTGDAKQVEVQTTNTADAPPDIPASPAREQATRSTATQQQKQKQQEGDVVIIGDTRNQQLERAEEAQRRHEVRKAVEPHEVGDGEVIGERVRPEQREHVEGARPKAQHPAGGHRR